MATTTCTTWICVADHALLVLAFAILMFPIVGGSLFIVWLMMRD